jgi:hypothetical protein
VDVSPAQIERESKKSGREAFSKDVGEDPELWLAKWRAGQIEDTQENQFRATLASQLEGHR